MKMHTATRTFWMFLVCAAAATGVLAQSAQDNKADAERLITMLEIRTGSVIGEVGAGDGALTFAIAKAVGESGRVFTNELNTDRVKALQAEAGNAGAANVTVVEGRETETNFPDQCCEAIFMRRVYHHFGDPPAMNASLMKSLKPGGRLAILDFTPPPGGEAAPGRRGDDNHHGITAPTLEKELKAAGFEIVSSSEQGRTVTVVARRPIVGT
jgi:ubiquinone/menaquinone biosynthesis C-methylase UbiE